MAERNARDVTADIIVRDKTSSGTRSVIRNVGNIKREVDKTNGIISKAIGHMPTAFGKIGPAAASSLSAVGAIVSKTLASAAASAPIAAAIAAAIALGAPIIAAALSAGILLGLGGGVLVAGIKAASSSPAVQKAWKGFGDRAKTAFKDFGKPFEGPLARAADTFGDALERMAPAIKGLGEKFAPIIDKVAPALASMAENALPGIVKAVESAAPMFEKIAQHAPEIGTAISKFFDKIAGSGPEANKFLEDMLNWLEGAIITLGIIVGWLAKMYSTARDAWSGIVDVVIDAIKIIISVIGNIVHAAAAAFGWIPGIGPKLKNAAKEFDKFQEKANEALDKIKNRNVKVNVTMSVSDQAARALRGVGYGAFSDVGSWYPAQFAASNFAPSSGGTSRTGGPVQVNQSLTVSLDGVPFREMIAQAIADDRRRERRRAMIGRR